MVSQPNVLYLLFFFGYSPFLHVSHACLSLFTPYTRSCIVAAISSADGTCIFSSLTQSISRNGMPGTTP